MGTAMAVVARSVATLNLARSNIVDASEVVQMSDYGELYKSE